MPFACRLILAAATILSLTAAAQTPDPCATAPTTCATLIDAHATSEIRIANTVVDVSLRITVSDKDLATTQRELSDKSTALLAYLRSQQVQRLSTTSVNFEPETRSAKNGPDRTVAYNGRSTISFRTLPDKAPAILADALDHGASEIADVTFTPSEEEIAATRRSLETDATKIALAKAGHVAEAAGLRVVSIRNISVNQGDQLIFTRSAGLVMNDYKERRAGGASPQIQTASGDASLSVTVNVTVAATH